MISSKPGKFASNFTTLAVESSISDPPETVYFKTDLTPGESMKPKRCQWLQNIILYRKQKFTIGLFQ